MKASRIVLLFNACFADSCDTILRGGAEEPFYQPAKARAGRPAVLHFTRDYSRSALHESAHWCIAGIERRKREDFGYHYILPPREVNRQQKFFDSERKVQSLEYIFCNALDMRFSPSADNFEVAPGQLARFEDQIHQEATVWLRRGVYGRAKIFLNELVRAHGEDKIMGQHCG